jgi:MFS family permease
VALHSLPLTYLGYGVVGGIGIGIGYVVPIGVLMRWFPDRRGLAAGLGVLGFGGGAALAAPLNEGLMAAHRRAPEYLGAAADIEVSLEGGRRVAEFGGGSAEVVVATVSDLASWGPGVLQEGVYVVGTGDTGVAVAWGDNVILHCR